jgi:hypothetical protein
MKTPLLLVPAFVLVAQVFAESAPALPPAAKAPAPPYLDVPAAAPLSPAVRAHLAAMKPIFDGKTLDGWVQAPVAPVKFGGEDVKDVGALVRRVTSKADAMSIWLSESLDDAGRAALGGYSATADAAATRTVASALVRNLNRIVAGPASVFDAARFAGVTLRPATEALRRSNPTGVAPARLNRLLLEDAFSAELVRSPSTSWGVKDGALASTGAGRGVIYTAQDYAHYRVVFQVRQISGNHVPGVLVFCTRPAAGELGLDALGGVQFQVPRGGHWDYRPGMNKAGDFFTRPTRIGFDLKQWAQVELLVNAKTGVARMAVAQPVGTKAIEILDFSDPAAGKAGPFALQMHNAGLFDEFRELRIENDPKDERLITVE